MYQCTRLTNYVCTYVQVTDEEGKKIELMRKRIHQDPGFGTTGLSCAFVLLLDPVFQSSRHSFFGGERRFWQIPNGLLYRLVPVARVRFQCAGK